jgi:hypothetical protein
VLIDLTLIYGAVQEILFNAFGDGLGPLDIILVDNAE